MPRISGCMIAAALLLTTACGDDALEALRADAESDAGKSCVTADESDLTFSGFAITEVAVETGAGDCNTRVCLVNHFKGRATCPYGQSDPQDPGCFLPGTSEPVLVRVEPQDALRRPELAVTCSCRCAGPDDGPFCTCPSGTECVQLATNLGLPGSAAVAGSYCIAPDAKWSGLQGPVCSPLLENCGPP